VSIDFFISYTAVDRSWAEWIAATLEDAGYTTVLQAWDFRPGENFVDRMDRAMRDSSRTIAVVSRDYYRSAYAVPEWTNAVTRDPTGRLGILLPVRIDDVILEGIFAAVTWIDLAGIDHDEACKRLVEGVKRERLKPSGTPSFPEGKRPRYPGALPPIWRVPHDRNPAFAGRDDILSQLRQRLAETRTQPAIAALTGTGGVGKTAIAVEHCYRALADYQVVWWVRAARREFATADLAALGDPLGISKKKGSDSPRDLAADLANVKEWLAQHDQWLVVLDEAEDEGGISGVIPQGGGGHVLLTSRSPAWRRQAAVVLEVPVLEPPSSLRLLEIRTGLEPDRYAGLLAEALGRLPLGLELAGAFIERQGIGFRDYLQRLKKAGGLPEGDAPPDYTRTLATVWSESLGSLERLAPEAGDLLRLCAYLAPDDLPRWLVHAGAAALPEPLKGHAEDMDALTDLIALPRSYSLVNTHGDSFGVHRLLQTILRRGLDTNGQQQWAGAAVAMMQRGFPKQAADTRLWERSGRLVPHAVAAAGYAEELAVNGDATVSVLDRVATYLEMGRDSAEAAEYRNRAFMLAERIHGREGIPVWLLNNHAVWLLLRGEIGAARPLLEQAITRTEAAGLSASLGTYYVNLAEVESRETKWERARDLLRRGVTILDRSVPQPDPKVATAYSKLGQVLLELGEMEEAEPAFRRAVELYTATVGPSAADTMFARSFLEGVRSPGRVPAPWFVTEVLTHETIERDKGKALIQEPAYRSEAEEHLREAAEGGETAALFHLWELLDRVPERKAEALEFLQRAAAAGVPKALYWRGRQLVDEPGLEAEAESMIRAAINAGETYSWYDLGLLLERDPTRRDETEAAFRAAVDAGYEEARNDLGLLLMETPGREDEGEQMLRETGHRGQPRSFHNLGRYLSDHGRYEEAIEVFRSAIAGGYLTSYVDLGIVLDRTGRRQEAEQEFRTAAASGEPRGLFNLGILCEMAGRIKEAEQAYRAAADANVGGVPMRLGSLLSRQPGREQEAAEQFIKMGNKGDPDGWLALARLASRMPGNELLAEKAYRNAIAMGRVEAWNNLGILLSRVGGRDQDAETAFLEAIRAGHSHGWHNLATHLENLPERAADAARAHDLAEAGAGPEALENWAVN
jgi:tetratricopeptide (TPR) repeat protein